MTTSHLTAAGPELIRFTGDGAGLELLAEETRGGKKLRPFQMTAYTGGAMRVPGYFDPVVVDLAGMSVPTPKLPILRQHDPDRIVAHSEAIDVSPQRLKLSGVMSGTGEAAGEVVHLADNGFPWQSSIGASVERREYVEPGQVVKVNGRNFTGPVNVARASTLREVSFVPLGADPATSASIGAGRHSRGLDMNFAEWCKARGINPDTLTDDGRATLEAAYNRDAAPPPASAAEREAERVATIEDLADDFATRASSPDAAERIRAAAGQAVAGGWDRGRSELAFIRAARPRGAGVSSIGGPPAGEVLECALAMHGGLQNLDRHYSPQVCEVARRQFKGGVSIVECAVQVAQRNGYRGHFSRGNLKEVLQAAVGWGQYGMVRADAGPSTYSIPNILSNVANKYALEGYNSVDQTWSQLASRRPVNDLKLITSVRLTGNLQFLRLAAGGEVKSGEIGEQAYNNQAHTFARTVGISREDWINDDTGALTRTSRELGIGGGDALNNEFWTVFLNNGTFFAAGNNNVGPAGALSLQSIGAADALFRLQTKPNGRPLGLVPSILLVPTNSRITALNVVNSTIVVATTTANQPLPSGNVLQGVYKVLSSPYMSNPAYTGYSATAFYLLADPVALSTIEGVFLYGVEVPTIETATFDWDQLGTSLRGYLDFGFALQEWRAGNRSPGV